MNVPGLKIVFADDERREILERIEHCLESGKLAIGENTHQFEEEFARSLGVPHAVATSSGGAALEMAMEILDPQRGEVLIPTNTYAATAFAVLRAGGDVRLVDADAASFGVNLQSLERAWTPATVGVVVVHVGGVISPQIHAIRAWCEHKGIWLLEDAAHAHGGEFDGQAAGTFGRLGAFSFFATKVVATGEGGMLVTRDDEAAKKARALRNYGKQKDWGIWSHTVGTNWRITEFASAMGLVQIRNLPQILAERRALADHYLDRLSTRRHLQPVIPHGKSGWHKFIVLLPKQVDRDVVKSQLQQRGVRLSGGVYEVPLHRQPCLAYSAGAFPVADDICARHICLPLYRSLTFEEIDYVVENLQEVVDALA